MTAFTLALGSEPLLVQRAVLRVSAAVHRQDPTSQRTVIPAGSETAARDLREAAAPNLFGDATVVVVEGIDAADDALAAAIRELLADPPDHAHVVFTHPGGTKGKALLDAIKAAGAEVVECQAVKRGRATVDFITKEFTAHRRKATPEAVTALYEAIGQDLGLLSGAVSQLVADVEANPIDEEQVRRYFAGVADVSGFVIADAVWDRRYDDALLALRQAVLATDSSRVGPATVASLAGGLRSLVRVGGMPPGASETDIAREAGVPAWKVRSLRKQWSRWSGDQRRLAAAVVALADADAAMKGGVREGSSLDAEQKLLALEILVTGASSGVRRD
jgi:DNA polymerase-3 subunit delta